MNLYTWRTDSKGVIWTIRDGEREQALTLGLAGAQQMDQVISRWEPLALKHSLRTLVPVAWILSMIWRESNGNPTARHKENPADPRTDGLGLMQLTIKYFAGNHSDAQLVDPDLNIQIGSDYCASLSKRYGGDFAKVSASFNAGSVRPSTLNPFGMVSTGNHIEAEVSASNYYLTHRLAPAFVGGPTVVTFTEHDYAEAEAVMAIHQWDTDYGARQLDDSA